jgi:hypothetical protein
LRLLRDVQFKSSRYIVDGRVVFSDVVRGDLRSLPEDDNVTPKHLGATIHN